MRSSRASLLLAAAAIALQPSLHAATHTPYHRLTASAAPAHHITPTLHHLALTRFSRAPQDLPAEPAPSSVNPPSRSSAFSLTTFAVHSMLGFFGHSAQ